MSPDIIVIGEADSKDIEYYNNYVKNSTCKTIKQNSAGDITLVCETNLVKFYVSIESYSDYIIGSDIVKDTVDIELKRFLMKRDNSNQKYGYYIGKLIV